MTTSKGAMRAAKEILSKFGKVHDRWADTCSEIIERETHAGQMAELLCQFVQWQNGSSAHDPNPLTLTAIMIRAERLLKELES